MLRISAVELLERDWEQAELGEQIAAACGGSGQVTVVEGAAGIGKTTLLVKARAEAKQAGMRVLAARGMELEREFPYGVVRQLFEPVLAGATEAELAELLAGPAGQATVLFGQVDPAAGSLKSGDASFAVLHGLFWLTTNLCAQQPVMLSVDDLHWSDAPSLRFLAYLLPRLEGLPVLVAMALRPAETGMEPNLLAQIVTDPLVTSLHLSPLSQAGSARLVRALLNREVEEDFCAACHAATGGNPLLLGELAAVVAAEGVEPTAAGAARLVELGPRAVGRRVKLWLSQLGPLADAVCKAVAILGDGALPAQVTALAGLELAETVEVARQLVDVEILYRHGHAPAYEVSVPGVSVPGVSGSSGTGLGFIHPLVRAAVYGGMREGERLAGHRRAAELLGEAGAGVEQVAAQLLLVPPAGDPAVVATLCQAADEAFARGSPDGAVTCLERCLAEPPPKAERAEVLFQLGAAAQLVDMAKAAKYLSMALALVRQPERRAVIAEMLGRVLYECGRYDEAAGVYTQARQALGEDHADLRRRLDAGLLSVAIADPALPLAAGDVDRLRSEPSDPGIGGRLLDTTLALYDALTGASAQVAVARARRGLADGVLIEQPQSNEGLIFGCLVLMAADLDEVMPMLDAWLAQAHQRGSMAAVGAAQCFRGLAWAWRGSLAEAEADLRDAMWQIETTGADAARPIVGAHLAEVLIEQGRLDQADAALDWVGMPEPLPHAGYWDWCLKTRARLLVLQGRIEDGLETLLACGRRFVADPQRQHNPAIIAWRSDAALALLGLGQRGKARVLAAEELRLARQWGAPRALGRALRVAGLVEEGEDGLALLREAVEVLGASPARLEYAKALIELGGALRRAGRRVEAREELRRGVDVAQMCGTTLLVEQGLSELRASGARPRRVEPSGPGALTPSERRVTELAAAGCSNRAIAQKLFVTVNTVEVHLTRAYRKLGITSRAELAHTLPSPSEGLRWLLQQVAQRRPHTPKSTSAEPERPDGA